MFTNCNTHIYANVTYWNNRNEGDFMYSEVFPSRLKQARKDYGLTQVETSKLLGIDRSTYTKYELGQRVPDMEILVKMGLMFEVTLDWLCGATSKGSTDHLKLIAEERARNEMLKKLEREALIAKRLELEPEPT